MKPGYLVSHATMMVVAGILVVAATLKTFRLTSLTWYVESSPAAYWTSFFAVIVDLILAALLLSGVLSRSTFLLTAVVFAGYAYLNLYFLITDQNCGCFGSYTPGTQTMLIADSIIAWLLFAISLRMDLSQILSPARGTAFGLMLFLGLGMFGGFLAYNSPAHFTLLCGSVRPGAAVELSPALDAAKSHSFRVHLVHIGMCYAYRHEPVCRFSKV